MTDYIQDIHEIVVELEKLKGYYDSTGLDLHIAVKVNGKIAFSTKHWGRVHYIVTDLSVDKIWSEIFKISDQIGRKLIKTNTGKPYVYVNKLNLSQTQGVFDLFKSKFGNRIERKFEFSWNIDDAVLP